MKLATALVLAACGSNEEPAPPRAPPTDLGSCTLEITRDAVGGPRPPSTVTETTAASWGEQPGLEIRCAGPQTTLTFRGARIATGTYAIAPGGAVTVDGRTVDGRLAMTDGTLEISALDATRVAGTFTLRTVFSQDRSRRSGKLQGRFDIRRNAQQR